MANKLIDIAIGKIEENPLNKRSMLPDEIEIIKESILEIGLLHPLAVYESEPDKYVLVSGHKRLRALKELGKLPSSVVQCMVIDKPSDSTKEEELLARANVHRSSPDEIAAEVQIMSNAWDNMDPKRRTKLTEKYKKDFTLAYAADPLYMQDPQQFITNRFRPRMDYINHMTGLNLSNRSISKYMKKVLKDAKEGLEEKPRKEKAVTIKHIVHAMERLEGMIEVFKSGGVLESDLSDLQLELRELTEKYGK